MKATLEPSQTTGQQRTWCIAQPSLSSQSYGHPLYLVLSSWVLPFPFLIFSLFFFLLSACPSFSLVGVKECVAHGAWYRGREDRYSGTDPSKPKGKKETYSSFRPVPSRMKYTQCSLTPNALSRHLSPRCPFFSPILLLWTDKGERKKKHLSSFLLLLKGSRRIRIKGAATDSDRSLGGKEEDLRNRETKKYIFIFKKKKPTPTDTSSSLFKLGSSWLRTRWKKREENNYYSK